MKIVYWSDYACPYCYIAEKRLKKAILELGLCDVEITVKAFELDKDASYDVVSSTDVRFAKKYGLSLNDAQKRIDEISALGKNEGIDFNYINTNYTNTLDAHRLTKYVAKNYEDKTDEVVELLFDAYFTKNLKLADKNVLEDIAQKVGIDKNQVDDMLNGDEFVDEVRYDEYEAQQLGIQGVPYFVFDDKYVCGGCLAKDEFKRVILKTLNENDNNESQGKICGINGCQ